MDCPKVFSYDLHEMHNWKLTSSWSTAQNMVSSCSVFIAEWKYNIFKLKVIYPLHCPELFYIAPKPKGTQLGEGFKSPLTHRKGTRTVWRTPVTGWPFHCWKWRRDLGNLGLTPGQCALLKALDSRYLQTIRELPVRPWIVCPWCPGTHIREEWSQQQ